MVLLYDKPEPVSELQISELEEMLKYQLPKDYRTFLKTHNGGRPKPVSFKYHDPMHGETLGSINKFFGIMDEDNWFSILGNFKDFRNEAQLGLLPIADEGGGNYIFMALDDENKGKIYYLNHNIDPSEGNLFFVANTFNELLDILFDYTEDEEDAAE